MVNDVANRPPPAVGLAFDHFSLSIDAVVMPVGRVSETADHIHVALPRRSAYRGSAMIRYMSWVMSMASMADTQTVEISYDALVPIGMVVLFLGVAVGMFTGLFLNGKELRDQRKALAEKDLEWAESPLDAKLGRIMELGEEIKNVNKELQSEFELQLISHPAREGRRRGCRTNSGAQCGGATCGGSDGRLTN